MAVAHGEVLGDWEDKLAQYFAAQRRWEAVYIKYPTAENKERYEHWNALCKAVTFTLAVLRESIVEAIINEGDPVSFFRDRLVPQQETLDKILLSAGPSTQKTFNEKCEQLFSDLEQYGGRI